MVDTLWRSLRKTTSTIHVDYGFTYATLFATDIRVKIGTPIMIELDLGKNLRTHNIDVGTYIDAKDLADGEIRRLKSLQLVDAHTLTQLFKLLQDIDYEAIPWRLILNLAGRHEFSVRPEFREQVLILRSVEL